MKQKPSRLSLADQAAAQLRKDILAGKLAGGQRLREAEMAMALGVSRGPLREAFKTLKGAGLVYDDLHGGTFVVRLSSADVHEIYVVRIAIETHAVKLITRGHRKRDVALLMRRAQRISDAAASGNQRAVARAELAFHESICALSGIERLHRVFLDHVSLLGPLFLLDERLFPALQYPPGEHKAIVRAIESGDEAAAARNVEEHLESAWKRMESYLRLIPLGQPSS